MKLEKINQKNTKEAAKLLVEYWKERGMNYSQKWATNYMKQGHKTEIKKDIFFAAKEKSKLVGTASIVIYEGNVAELRDLVIKKQERGKGCGNLLLKELIKVAKKNKVRKLYALVFPTTKQIYQKAGFRQEGYLKSHFAKKEDLCFMSRFL